MIQLNVDYSLLNRFFGLSLVKIAQYGNKDFEEIMKLEAAQGNTKARDYKKILSDPDKLLEIFKLSNWENKYIILQNMSEGDLDNLLPLLTQEQLAMGLNFFTDEKLIMMSKELPVEPLANMIFEQSALVDVLALMDDNSMDKFLNQPDVDRRYSQKYFESLDRNALEKIMVYQYGIEFKDKKREDYLNHLYSLDDRDYNKFLCSMERESKIGLIAGIVEQKEDFVYLFEAKDLVKPMELLTKGDKVKMMATLEPEFLIPMIQELPLDLTGVVLTQIDPNDFAEVLAQDFQDILSSIVLFSNGAM